MRIIIPFVLALLLTSAHAQAQVLLKFKFLEGASATLISGTESNQTLTIAGTEVVTASSQKRTIATSNSERSADGTIRVKQEFKALESTLSLPGGVELQFDSKNPDAPAPGTEADFLLDILKATSQSSWTMIDGQDNRVVAVEGGGEALDALDESTRALVEKQFDPAYLKEQANAHLDIFPTTPVSNGETWRRTSDMRLEGGQTLTFTTDYEYKGTVNNGGKELDQIEVRVKEVDYAIDADAPTPLQVKDSDLKIAESTGTILFDRQSGQIVEQTDKLRITGEITFTAGGMDLPGKVDLSIANTVKRT